MRNLCVLFLAVLTGAGCAVPASALDVDFDAYLFEVEIFLGTGFELRDLDNDGNGIIDQDQLGMLSAILDGGAGVDAINTITVTDILAGYQQNYNAIPGELTVNIPSQGSVALISELQGSNPALAVALQNLLAGYLTIADPGTIDFINAFADQVIVKILSGTPAEEDISDVQDQITFTAAAFATFGSAPGEPDFLGPAGDIDADVFTNINEYTTPSQKTREEWLAACMIDPPLRIASLIGGGTKVSGLSLLFESSAAGGMGGETFEWHKGNPGSSTAISNSSIYTVPFGTAADSGGYFCVISDGVTTRTTPVLDLTVVFVPLFITQNISGGTRQVGTAKTFSVGAQGGSPGPYVYTWMKDGGAIGSNEPTLELTNLQESDSGQYSVTVTSNGGGDAKTSGPVTLTVVSPDALIITEQPEDADKMLGANHTFTVEVSGGSGNYSYNWTKGGVSLGAIDQDNLTITAIELSDAGNYRCVITDVDDTDDMVTTSVARLRVVYDDLEFTAEPESVTKMIEESHTFEVAVIGGSGNYDYDWRRNSSSLGAPNQASLTLVDIQPGDAGNYRCKVTDQLFTDETITSSAATLTVDSAPIFVTTQPLGGMKFVGASHTFTIAAGGGSGQYDYAWFVDDAPLCDCNFNSVTLSPLALGDSGEYKCVISDANFPEVTTTTDVVTLSVMNHMNVTIVPETLELLSGESGSLTVMASEGFPPYSYEWRYNGTPIVGAPNDPVLPLGPANLTDAGDYSCRVADQVESKTSAAAAVSVELVPIPNGSADFDVNLTPDQAVPPHESNGFGRAQGTISATAKGSDAEIFISIVHTVSEPQDIGIYNGGPGINGELLVLLGNGVVSVFDTYPISEEIASKIVSGYAYVAITDAAHPNGDVRTPLFPVLGNVEGEGEGGFEGEGEGAFDGIHSADTNADLAISLSELLRVIQFFNLKALHCEPGTEDDFAPGAGDQGCAPHDSDYNPQDWSISLSETLRSIQFFNSPGRAYFPCELGEDGFCPGPPPGALSGLPRAQPVPARRRWPWPSRHDGP